MFFKDGSWDLGLMTDVVQAQRQALCGYVASHLPLGNFTAKA